MDFLDVRTVIFSHLITDTVCVAMLLFLWLQNRRRFAGTFFWVADFCFQTLAVFLIILRGSIPDRLSIGFSNPLVAAGALLGYLGLVRFVGKKSPQIHNYLILAVLVLANSYYAFVRPSLEARNLIISFGLLVICFQCAWLTLRRVEKAERRKMLAVGLVFGLFCLVSLVRIIGTLAAPQQTNDFFRSDVFETLTLLAYQILLILLAFSLVLLANYHLIAEARSQEEKFTKAFHSSPYAISLTRPSDGRILEVNDAFVRIAGYSHAEAVGKTTSELHLWVRDEDRAGVIADLSQGKPVHGRELEFRRKSGETMTGLFSAEPIMIDEQPWILSSISDISERKQAEMERDSLAKFPSENPNPTLRLDSDGTILYANPASQALLADWKTRVGKRAPKIWRDIVAERLIEQATRTTEVTSGGRVYSFFVVPIPESKYVNLYGRDITVRKQAEQELAESERRYRSLFENMLNGFSYCRMLFENGKPQDFIYLAVNPAFERLTGLKEVTGRKVSEAIPGIRQSDPKLFETYGRVALTGNPETFETYLEALKMWFSISVYSPQKEYFVAVFDVITERKEMEDSLRDSEANFRALAENAGEGILIAAEGGIHLFANQAMVEISGYGVDELLSLTAQELSDPQETAQVLDRLKRRLAGESVPNHYETAILRKDGSQVPVQISSSKTIWKGQPADIVFVQDISQRKRTEEIVRQNDRRLNYSLISAELGAWELNLVDGTAWRSLKHDQIFGYETTLPNWTFDMFMEHVLPEDRARVKDDFDKALATGTDLDFECRIRRKDGEVSWIWATGNPEFDEKNKPSKMFGIVQDITERKQAEAARQESEILFRTLFELSPDAIVLLDPNDPTVHSRIVDCNAAACLMNGYIRDELIGQSIDIVNEAPYTPSGQIAYLDQLRKAGSFKLEVIHRHKSGVAFPVEVSTTIINVNGRELLIGIDRDITERKKAEEELRESEDKFKYVFDYSTVGKSITLPAGEIHVNKSFCEMLGFSPEELQSKRWQEISHPDDIEATQKEIDHLLSGEKDGVRFTKRYLHKNGSVVWADVSTALRRDREGNPLYFMTTVVDITERKRVEEALAHRTEELVRSNADLEQFAYVASHDLQEPLRMVSSYMQLLERRYKGKLDKDADEFIGFAVDGAERMQRLISDLLAYSRVGTRGQPFAAASCKAALQQALANLQILVEESQAKVTSDPLPEVIGDEAQLVQLFQNLISNAVKFHGEKAPRVWVTVESGEKEWVFSVRDNGIGIEPQYAERIFIIFQRLHDRSKYAGTGIGLAICKKIVQRHGGRIWVESKPGKGSTFYFTLPKIGGEGP